MTIKFSKVRYRYGRSERFVFDDFSHEFGLGLTILKGYSGCGKSTLLKLASGLLKPQKGKVLVETKGRMRSVGSATFLKKDVSFVFQQLNLLPLASIERNVMMAAGLAGEKKEEGLKWLATLGVADLAKKKPSQLSGGQQQRAALARALAKRPRILLLDEPTSGLDDKNTALIAKVLQEDLPEGTTCLLATHDARLLTLSPKIIDFDSFSS